MIKTKKDCYRVVSTCDEKKWLDYAMKVMVQLFRNSELAPDKVGKADRVSFNTYTDFLNKYDARIRKINKDTK